MKQLLISYGVRAVVAFLTVFLAIIASANLADIGGAEALSLASTAAVAGIGSALRVLQSFIEDLGKRYGVSAPPA